MERVLFLMSAGVYVFAVGSMSGWIFEFIYRSFIARDEDGIRMVNPGFLAGPCLPIYGVGTLANYLIACMPYYFGESKPVHDIIVLFAMMLLMTVIELATGIFFRKVVHVELWDYSNFKHNYKGLICPQFTIIWLALDAFYYYAVHPLILTGIDWLGDNTYGYFFTGIFLGILVADIAYSSRIFVKLKTIATKQNIVLKYEEIKEYFIRIAQEGKRKVHFIFTFMSADNSGEFLKDYNKKLPRKLRNAAIKEEKSGEAPEDKL